MRSNFEPGRVFANHLDFPDRLDAWTDKARPGSSHRSCGPGRSAGRGVPADATAARKDARPRSPPDAAVPAQPFVRMDRNDYSIDPAFGGRRVEVRVSQPRVTAVVLDTGELAARLRRVFAGGLTITDPAHETRLERHREQDTSAIRSRSRCGRSRAMTS